MATRGDGFDDGGPEDFFQLVVELLEEMTVTVLEGIRERPGVAAAILAGIVGAFVGLGFAAWKARRQAPPPPAKGLARAVGAMASAIELEQRAKWLGKGSVRSAKKAGKQTGRVAEAVADAKWAADLLPTLGRLAENPLVREIARDVLSKQLSKRFS